MNKRQFQKIILGAMLFTGVAMGLYARPAHTNCLKVKIFSKSKLINLKDKQYFVLHFQMENCGIVDLPFDFYAKLGYPKDSACNIYFTIDKATTANTYEPYDYKPVDYDNVIDSVMILRPRKIYSFYLPIFTLYDIKDAGNYRIQGFYRFKTEDGGYFIQRSDYLYLVVIK
jgi:hypothetical protein